MTAKILLTVLSGFRDSIPPRQGSNRRSIVAHYCCHTFRNDVSRSCGHALSFGSDLTIAQIYDKAPPAVGKFVFAGEYCDKCDHYDEKRWTSEEFNEWLIDESTW